MLSLALAAALMVQTPTETPLALPSSPAELHGSLLTPASEAAAVAVILPGSGPTDRDGDSPLGVQAHTYRLLAQALVQRGVATVRIDKRGIGESRAAGPAEQDLRFQTYADDALAWARLAAERTGRPCAWLIGHSEGALVALAAAQGHPAEVCGLVLISGAGRPAGDVLREQLATLPEPLHGQALDALTELEAGRPVADPPPQLAALLRPSVQRYMMSWLTLDPAALATSITVPVLIVQGDTDLQVGVADAQRLQAARPDADLVILPGVNHVLKTAPTDRAANLATYVDPDLPLADGVAAAVADFIQAR